MEKIRGRSEGHVVDILFTLALFCVFAASSLMVVIIGANVYKSTVQSQDRNFNTCTSLSYVSSKVRQHDVDGGVSLSQLGGVDALVLEQQMNGNTYQTWIYYYEGSLRELFIAAEDADTTPPDAGAEIVSIQNFTITKAGEDLLHLVASSADGEEVEMFLSLRT